MGRQRALEAALDTLRAHMDGCPAGTRLPSLTALAADAGVSRRTMWSAAQQHVALGTLRARRGDGLIVTGEGMVGQAATGTAQAAGTPRERAWESIRDALRRDIYRGGFRTGDQLPTVKELRSRYGVSYRTVKQALHALAGERMLEQHGVRWQVRGHSREGSHHRIALVTRRFPEEAQGRVPPRHAENLMLFESECRRRSLQVSPVRLSFVEHEVVVNEDRDGVLDGEGPGGDALGIIFWPITIGRGLERVWRRMLDTGRPIAISASATTSLWFLTSAANDRVQVLRTGKDYEAGIAMGQHLVARGHEWVAFICTEGLPGWAEGRLRGMRTVFRDAGLADDAIRMFNDPAYRRPASRDDSRLEMSQEIERVVGRLADAASSPMIESSLRQLRMHVHSAVESAQAQSPVLPLCRRACEWGKATAYVGANDLQALVCSSYLRSRGVRPDQVSIAGFDNTRESMLSGLTTYDFGTAASIYRSIDFVLHPFSARQRRRGMVEEHVEGQLVDRGSVRELENG